MSRRKKPDLPWPLTKVTKHPLQFLLNKVHTVAVAGVGTYVGVLIIAALYYLLFETTGFMTSAWHSLVPDSALRHDIRNVGEGLLGGVIAQSLIWNHWKIGKPKLWDRVECKLGIPNIHDANDVNGFQLAVTPLLVILYAVPGFFAARWLATEFHLIGQQAAALGIHADTSGIPPLLQRMKDNVTSEYPQKLMGYGAAFVFGRHPAKGVYDDVQGWFATQRLMKGKESVPRLLPPTYRARFNHLKEVGLDSNMKQRWQVKLIAWGSPLALLLAGFGWYVLNFIAYR